MAAELGFLYHATRSSEDKMLRLDFSVVQTIGGVVNREEREREGGLSREFTLLSIRRVLFREEEGKKKSEAAPKRPRAKRKAKKASCFLW